MNSASWDVVCADRTIAAAVCDLLAREFPRPARPLTLEIAVGEPAVPEGAELLFEQPATRFYGAAPDTLIVASTAAPAVAVLDSGATARVTLSPEAVGRLDETVPYFLAAVVTMLYRRIGWHHVHAAMLEDPQGRCWLFAGNSRSGKSTTAALLAANGWRLGGDDGVFLAEENGRVVARALTKSLALRPHGLELLAPPGGRFAARRGKTEFAFADLTDNLVSTAEPEVVAFTSIAGGSTVVRPVTGSAVLTELVRWSAWVALERAFAQEHLDLLARLGNQARCYSVNLAVDITRQPQMLMEATR